MNGGARLGREAAPPFVVEFLDYQCPYCASTHPLIDRYLRGHPDEAVVIRHYPLPTHGAAEGAARAAICAEAQGEFARMHARLFESDEWQVDRDWTRLAMEVGVGDITEFERCLDSPETDARLEADRVLAAEFGIRATPTFVSRRSMHVGSLDRWTMSQLATAAS